MEKLKRVEIVVDAVKAPELIEELERQGISGWSVIGGGTGSGSRGRRSGEELTGVFENRYILVACKPEQLDPLISVVRPILERFGGLCLVSDALSVLH
jgi:nitrogen regulatory protein PII